MDWRELYEIQRKVPVEIIKSFHFHCRIFRLNYFYDAFLAAQDFVQKGINQRKYLAI